MPNTTTEETSPLSDRTNPNKAEDNDLTRLDADEMSVQTAAELLGADVGQLPSSASGALPATDTDFSITSPEADARESEGRNIPLDQTGGEVSTTTLPSAHPGATGREDM